MATRWDQLRIPLTPCDAVNTLFQPRFSLWLGGYQMANDGPKHKLVAILAADIVGFSRMMEADQAGTHSQLGPHRKEVVNPAIEEAMVGLAEHNGILEHTSGSVDLSTNSRLMADNAPAASSVVIAAELVR